MLLCNLLVAVENIKENGLRDMKVYLEKVQARDIQILPLENVVFVSQS